MYSKDTQINISQIRSELRQILCDVSGVDMAAIEDDVPLFDFIVSSLALINGMRRVYEQFGVLISIRNLLEGQLDLNALVVYIDQELATQDALKGEVPVTPATVVKPNKRREVPLAPSQQHIAFLTRYSNEASAAYNEALVVRLEGRLDGPALQAAIEAVGERYEALHTALSQDKDALEILSDERIELVVSRCTPEHIGERLAEIVHQPFIIGMRLFRVELLRISETDHVLALIGHALIIDSEALVNVLDDITTHYEAFVHSDEFTAPPSAMQWTAYVARREDGRTQEARAAAEGYWTNAFPSEKSAVPRLELPSDRPRPPVKNYAGARLVLPIPADLGVHLDAWATAEHTTSSTVLFGAFTLLLHRLSGQKEIVVGVASIPSYIAFDQRAVARTWDMVPVRSTFDLTRSFAEHIRAGMMSLAEAYDHDHLSLAELLQLLDLGRDQSRSALFTAVFRTQSRCAPPRFDALDVSFITAPIGGARYDIELTLNSTESGMELICDYSSELFYEESVLRWLRGILETLHAGIQPKAEPVGWLPIMSKQEQQMLLDQWNATETPYPDERTVLDLILEQARTHADYPAVLCSEETLTYRQLMARVEEIAQLLHARQVQPGDRVALLLPRSPDLIASMLAAWRVGALYLPLDHTFPQKRLAFMLDDADVRAVVTTQSLMQIVKESPTECILCLDDLVGQPSVLITDMAFPRGADSAYLLYTSGSTGRPKGVDIKHYSLVNHLLATQKFLEFTPDDSILALTTVSFDIAAVELLMPLIAGGIVDLDKDGLAADGIALAQRIKTRKPSHIQATPSTWKTLLAAGWCGDANLCIVSTGEALSRELAEELIVRCRVLWNLYGPTETTIHSAYHRVQSAPEEPVPIGRPYPNTELYILDEQAQPVPVGAIGELYIGGDGLAKGYWRRPELTNQCFVPNPFRAEERLYRTGDLARYQPNGNVICLGRIDHQVKVRGVRVELAEIESALRSTDCIHDAVVVSSTDAHNNTQLVAHIIAASDSTPTPAEIRAKLREQLPAVMVPSHFFFTNAFPLTANGKIHRASLQASDMSRNTPQKSSTKPSTPTERLLAEAWGRVLGVEVDHIGRDDDFMDLGGHSLLMTPLMLEVRKLFHVSFTMREFFAASSIKAFAALIDERRRMRGNETNGHSESVPYRNREWGKQRMAFLEREAALPRHIAPERGMIYRPAVEIGAVFLTGATGFLGAYIVSEILKTTEADLHCLVRPRRGEDSKARIEKQLKKYDVWQDDEKWQTKWNHRVHVVEGDVTLPRMGVTDPIYESLAREIDAIINAAAHVNFIYPYEALRATNVLGLHEIIRFAFHARIKPVHHLSTAAIWPMGAEYTFYERDPIEHGKALNLGYDEAKWVGEKCLLNAAERGLPVARYRPGEVGGDSQTGRCVTDHFIIAAIKGFLQFGAFPTLDMYVDIAPVDYVAQAVIHMIFRCNPLGRSFHLTNPQRCHMSDALTFLRSLDYQFEEIRFEEIRDQFIYHSDLASNALFPYQPMLSKMRGVDLEVPTYDCKETLRELEGSNIVCPSVDDKLFGTYMQYLRDIGYMPDPAGLARKKPA